MDAATDDIYVINAAGSGRGPTGYGSGPTEIDDERVVCRFDAVSGEVRPFTAGSSAGKSCLDGKDTPSGAFGVEGSLSSYADVAIDNSGVNPGRIYVSEFGPVHAFAPDGGYLWTLSGLESCGVAVDDEGHPWVVDCGIDVAREFDAAGSPPAQIDSFLLQGGLNRRPRHPAVDHSGAFYLAEGVGVSGIEKYVGGAFNSVFSPETAMEIALDPADPAGHLFANSIFSNGFREYDLSGAQVTGSPFGEDVLQRESPGVAYHPGLDRVYFSNPRSRSVKVFGPVTSGTVPEVASEPTGAITRSTATAHATVNPLGLPNAYRFEWTRGGNEVQHLRIRANSGEFELEDGAASTGPLPFDVSAAALQSALEGLGSIGAGNVEVSGTQSLEGENTVTDYDLTFVGQLAGTDVEKLGVVNLSLLRESGGVTNVGEANIIVSADPPAWGAAQSSAPQSLPADSSDHEVSSPLTGLDSNASYAVRVVAINTENDLSAYAAPPAVFMTLPPPPPTVSIDSVTAITTSSAHLEATIDPQEETTTWRAQRRAGSDCEGPFSDVGAEQTIEDPGPGPVSVDFDFTGLLPAQSYCLRIVAANPGGSGADQEAIQTLAVAPTEAGAAFAAPRTDTSVRINARVNPEGEAPLTYGLEWKAEGAPDWVAGPERVSGAAAREPIVVAEELSGLEPQTTYRYRLAVAENEAGPATLLGEERTFTTRSATEAGSVDPAACPNEAVRRAQRTHSYLASCRGIELVSSPEKGNQNVFVKETPNGAPPHSPDGERLIWTVGGSTPKARNGTEGAFLARRGPGGWASEPIAPPASEQLGEGGFTYRLMTRTPDFGAFFFNAALSTLLAKPEPPSVVRSGPGGPQELLRSYGIRPLNRIYEGTIEVSDDGRHVLIPHLETRQLEDIGDPAAVELLSVMPGGAPSACGLEVGTGESFGPPLPGYRTISADASRAFFLVQPNSEPGVCEEEAPLGLYVRVREGGSAETIAIDAPGPGEGEAPELIRAAPDGRRAFFLSPRRLEGADENDGTDVYLWEEAEGASRCLSCEAHPDVEVSGDAMVSDDLSHVYFESEKQVLPGQGAPGPRNAYVLAEGELGFVARLGLGGAIFSLEGANHTEMSADGERLLFSAAASPALSADVFAPACLESSCKQLYLYEDGEASLECISCRPAGVTGRPLGNGSGPDGHYRLSADGSTAAFATSEALLERDVNGDVDVYEWRGGARGLITDGVSEFASGETTAPRVQAIDADGSEVFFGLVPPDGSLTGYEREGLLNAYDARIGGGFEPPAPAEECEGDACQGPLEAAPAPTVPASAGFLGHGNPPRKLSGAARCARAARAARRGTARARRLRAAARRAGPKAKRRRLRAAARRRARRARRLARRAKRCRAGTRATRRAGQ